MHDQRRRAAPAHHRARRRRLLGECDERVGGRLLPLGVAACLLVGGALLLGDVPDRLLEDRALLERQPAAEHELAPPARPRHAQRPPRIQRLVVGDHGRRERARDQPDRARRLADRDARQLGITLRRRELRSRRDLIERQHPRAQRVVERRQAPQRDARPRDLHRASVVAARDLREPLRARRAARRPPITIVIGLTHELCVTRWASRACSADRRPAHAAAAHDDAQAPSPTAPSNRREHTFERTSPRAAQLCRLCAESSSRRARHVRRAPTPPPASAHPASAGCSPRAGAPCAR